MSLIKILRKTCRKALFTTPSHGQKYFIFNKFRNFYKYDISETDFYNPQEALEKAELQASKIYGTKSTLFLTNGSSSGIIAAVLASVSAGEKVLLWRNAHPCHNNAVKLAGGVPVYYDLQISQEWDIPIETTVENIEPYFKNEKIKAVIVTSPTYEGIVSDIQALKSLCSKYGAYLIVDEAHGALYPFSENLPESAVKIADFTIQSLHKTAGGLNPTALLHCNCNLDIKKGEIVSLVGESGCGKSTLANCILKLITPEKGEIYFENENILNFNKKETFEYRKKIQMIFQNPYSSLNPKMKIKETLMEPLIIHKEENKKERINEIIELVGISKADLEKYPHEFSGGQRQRIAIARALILKPKFIVADEPVSALDVSICASIINLLIDLREKLNLTILFISHDLNLVRYLSDKIAVMNKGEIVEFKPTMELFDNPEDDYTKFLLSSIRTIKTA